MRTNITISVEVDVLVTARQRIGNISAFCNEAMKQVAQLEEKEMSDSLPQLRSLVAGKAAELAELHKHINKAIQKEEDEKPVRVIE